MEAHYDDLDSREGTMSGCTALPDLDQREVAEAADILERPLQDPLPSLRQDGGAPGQTDAISRDYSG